MLLALFNLNSFSLSSVFIPFPFYSENAIAFAFRFSEFPQSSVPRKKHNRHHRESIFCCCCFLKNIHVSMGKTEKSPFHSSPFKIIEAIDCQGGKRIWAGSYKGFDTRCSTDHSKQSPCRNLNIQWQEKGKERKKPHPNPSDSRSVKMSWKHWCLLWRMEEKDLIEEHSFLQMCSLKLCSAEVTGPTRTCKDYWMRPSIFSKSLGPDTNAERMREQRRRAISTKPVTFFIKIRTHARGLKSGQCCIHL